MQRDPQWLERLRNLRTIQTITEADLPSLDEVVQFNDRHLILRTCRDAIQRSPDPRVRVKAATLLARIRGFCK